MHSIKISINFEYRNNKKKKNLKMETMENTKKYTIELTDAELSEILAKLANEIKIYDEQVSEDLKSGFSKMFNLVDNKTNNCYITTLVKKYSKKIV